MIDPDEHIDELLLASADRWRASLPEPQEFDIAGLVHQSRPRRPLGSPLARFASIAVALLATVGLLMLLVAGPLGVPAQTPVPPLPSPTLNPGLPDVLYVENRGGPALTVAINGIDVGTVACGAYPTFTPGDNNVPPLPWQLTIALTADGSTVLDQQVTQLPRWLVQIQNETLGISNYPVLGPPPPSCPPDGSYSPETATPTPMSQSQTLLFENRGGPAFTVAINGTYFATVACGTYPTLNVGAGGVPQLPWQLTIVRVSDGSTLVDEQVTQLPKWFIQIGDSVPVLTGGPALGPAGPSCPPAGSTPTASPEPTPTLEPAPTGYTVHVARGLHPQWTAEAAAAAAFDYIKANESNAGRALVPAQILSVEAMAGGDVPQAISGPYPDLAVAWVVHSEGTFYCDLGPARYDGYYTGFWQIFSDEGVGTGGSWEHPYPTP